LLHAVAKEEKYYQLKSTDRISGLFFFSAYLRKGFQRFWSVHCHSLDDHSIFFLTNGAEMNQNKQVKR